MERTNCLKQQKKLLKREETSFIPFVEGFEQSAVAVGGESK